MTAVGIGGLGMPEESDGLIRRLLLSGDDQFKILFENLPDGAFSLNSAGEFLELNQAMIDILGYSKDDLIGRHYEPIVLESHREETAASFARALSGECVQFPVQIVNKAGDTVEIEVLNVPIVINQDFMGVYGIAKNVTRLNHGRRVLQSALKELKDIKYALDKFAVVTVTDANGMIVDVNNRFCELSQYDRDELIGQTHRVVNSGVHPKTFFKSLWETISRGEIWNGEICNRAKDGTLYWADSFIVPFLDDAGRPYRFMAFRTDITEKVRLQQRLNQQLYYDDLTGLANRALFEDMLQLQIQTQGPGEPMVAVMFLELHRFKYINDHLGYSIGDKLLQVVSNRLSAYVGADGMIARFGGDEFVLMRRVWSTRQAMAYGNELVRLFEQAFDIENQYELQMTASVGISMFPQDARCAAELVRAANTALYRAKEDPSRRVQAHSPSSSVRAYKMFSLANDLPKAVHNGEFCVHYQPQVDTKTGRVIGAEALLRWMHPDWGMVSPTEFISIAEETGLIVDITKWVVRTVAIQWLAWVEAGFRPIRIGVNFSAHDLAQKNLVGDVEQIFRETGFPAQWLGVEVTETMIVQNDVNILLTLQQLRKMGIRIALDDFGTGYSSLNYLRKLPADVLKIDRSFISQWQSGDGCAEIIKAVIQLSHVLDMTVIAEGVESEEQVAFLEKESCDALQGYLISRPLPTKEFTKLLEATEESAEKSQPVRAKHSPAALVVMDDRRQYQRVQLTPGLRGIMQIGQIRQRVVNVGPTEIVIENIGSDGLCLFSNLKLPVTPHVTFHLTFTALGLPLTVTGYIVWVDETADNVYEYGFQFLMDAKQRNELVRALDLLTARLEAGAALDGGDFLKEDKISYLQHQIRDFTSVLDVW